MERFGRRTRPVRGEAARLDQRDVNVERSDLLRQRLGEPLERPLRRVVDADVLERRDAADRRHLDDVPAALGAQVGKRGLGDPQRAEHVGLDLVARLLLGQLLDEAEVPVACVVDHDVQPAEVVVGLPDRGEVRVAVGHVELDRQQRVAVFLGQVGQRRGVARGGGDLVAALQGRDRPLPAESARRARDEPNFACHFSNLSYLLLGLSLRLSHGGGLPIPGLGNFTGTVAGVSRASLDKDPREVASMFDAVARRYDLTNTVLSLGQDRFWRRATRSALRVGPGDKVLDLAAGTAVSTVELAVSGAWCVAADFSVGMLAAGAGRHVPKVAGDATRLPFADGVFDAVTISFGLRNVVDHAAGLREMARVTRPGGRLVVCEFSTPTNPLFATAYKEYLMQALPRIARAVSSNPDAYVYLAESIRAWPDQAELAHRIADAGWSAVRWRNLTGGIVALHAATKPLR